MSQVLNSKSLNGWYLFGWVSAIISAFTIWEMLATDLSTGSGLSHMISYSVRWAVPLIFMSLIGVVPTNFQSYVEPEHCYADLFQLVIVRIQC